MNQELIEQLSNKLHSQFVMNPTLYASQQASGPYKTIYQNISPAVIQNMLCQKESLLTYQEYQGFMRWVCLDFDIKKGFEADETDYQNDLLRTVRAIAQKLESEKINYLVECSGNRGIHLWVIFNNELSKHIAYSFVSDIKNSIGPLPSSIEIDLFPKTNDSSHKSKGIGLGVKLPLSKHKKSDRYSFFYNNVDEIELNKNTWPSNLNDSVLQHQLTILNNYDLNDTIEITTKYQSTAPNSLDIKITEINTNIEYKLDEILNELNKRFCIAAILKDYRSNLSNRNRMILVGLLSRIRSANNSNLGMKLLKNFFSRIGNYDEEKTKTQLERLKYLHPLNCKALKAHTNVDCRNCICEHKTSPLECLANVEINKEFSGFNINEQLFNNVKNAQINYINSNDEVAVHHTKLAIRATSYQAYESILEELYHGILKPQKELYEFNRFESEHKVRKLFCLNAQDKIISTASLSLLNNIWFDSFSNNSFGYRVNTTLNQGWIFENWLNKWNEFVHNIRSILYATFGAYDKYQMIKIDLKSFYDKIDHQKLRIKVLDQPISPIKERLLNLKNEERTKYENIINYLFKLLKVTNPDNGVPQGPAYARFFAEIYLLELDRLIEEPLKKGYEFYFRFVDDIFIFVESETSATQLYRNITDWLKLNRLEVNSDKTLQTTVEYFKLTNAISKYESESKYHINKIISHSPVLQNTEKNQVLSQAQELLINSKFGLKDNFRFVLSKFPDPKELTYYKKQLEPIILQSKFGRGTLYKAFFENYYFRKETISLLNDKEVGQLTTLAKQVYINQLIESFNLFQPNQLINHVKSLVSMENHTTIEKVGIFQLLLKSNEEIPSEIIKEIDIGVIETILYSNEKITLTASVLNDELYSRLFPSELSSSQFFHKFRILVFTNHIAIQELRELASYFWKRIAAEKYQLLVLQEDTAYLENVFNLIALFTIALNQVDDFTSELKHTWSIFLNFTSSKNLNIKHQFWFKSLTNQFEELEPSTIIACITMKKEGGLAGNSSDEYKILKRYTEIIIAIYKDCLTEKFELDQETIASLKQSDSFIKWIYDHNAKMYPNTEICLSNIARNNLIMMNKGNSYLVKSLTGNLTKFNYLNYQDTDTNIEDTHIFKINNDYSKLTDTFKKSNTLDAIEKVIKLYDRGLKFKEEHKTKGYPNYFIENTRVDENLNPTIPYLSNAELFIYSENKQFLNNEEGFCTLLLDLLYSLDLKLCEQSLYSFDIVAANESKLFPKPLDTKTKQISFLKTLISKIDLSQFYVGPHSIEIAWANALFEHFDGTKHFTKYLEHYFEHHKTNNRTDNKAFYQMVFTPSDKLDDSSLDSFCHILKDNIVVAGAREAITELYNSVRESVSQQLSIDSCLLQKAKVEIKETDEFEPDSNNILIVNDREYDLLNNKISYMLLDMEEGSKLIAITQENTEILKSKRTTFSAHINNSLVIVLVPRSFANTYDAIVKRTNWLTKENLTTDQFRLLYNCEKDINDSYQLIEEAAMKIAPHYRISDISAVIQRVIDWLLIFNKVSIKGSETETYMKEHNLDFAFLYQSLLDIIKLHNCIDTEDIEQFKKKLEAYKDDNKAKFFTLKNINRDRNGLQHLIFKCGGEKLRVLEFDDCYRDIVNIKENEYNIVILSDVGISGTEFRKALRFYVNNTKYDSNKGDDVELNDSEIREALVSKEKYFDYDYQNANTCNMFRAKFFGANSIKIVTAISTTEFESKVTETIDKHTEDNGFQKLQIDFESSKKLSCYNYEHLQSKISSDKRKLFETLVKDQALLKTIFTDDWKAYKSSMNRLNKSNLILRLESTPKGRFRLFTMKTKEGNKSLFERRREHNEKL